MELPRADDTVRAAGRLAFSVAACVLLVPSGLLLIALAIMSSEPNSDTGATASTESIVALSAVGASLLLSSLPVVYLVARSRAMVATLVTTAGLAAALVALYAS